MFPSVPQLIRDLWFLFLLVWFVGAFFTKHAVRKQTAVTRLREVGLGVLAGFVAVSPLLDVAPFNSKFLLDTPAGAVAGLLLTFVGIAFTIWARFSLGSNWSGHVTLKQDHALVTSGPYALVRHPIYSGILLAILGTAVAYRELRGLLALAIIFIAFVLKSRLEETFMLQHFGAQYSDYAQRVKALIPFVY